jgi:hypothetical protein
LPCATIERNISLAPILSAILASRQPFGGILKPCANHLARPSSLAPTIRRNPQALCNFLKRQARYPDCRAAIFFWLARYPDCHSAIFFFWPVQSVNCRAGIFLLAGAIHQLPRCDFFLLAGAIYRSPRRDFSFGRRNPSITALHFFF